MPPFRRLLIFFAMMPFRSIIIAASFRYFEPDAFADIFDRFRHAFLFRLISFSLRLYAIIFHFLRLILLRRRFDAFACHYACQRLPPCC